MCKIMFVIVKKYLCILFLWCKQNYKLKISLFFLSFLNDQLLFKYVNDFVFLYLGPGNNFANWDWGPNPGMIKQFCFYFICIVSFNFNFLEFEVHIYNFFYFKICFKRATLLTVQIDYCNKPFC